MSKHEQMLEASIHFWVLREEKRIHEPASDHEIRCTAKEKLQEICSSAEKQRES